MEFSNIVLDHDVDNFKTSKLVLDTTTVLQNQYFEENDSLFFGYEKNLEEVSFGKGAIGYVVFIKDNEPMAALVECQNGFKIIGVVKLPRLKEKEEFINCNYPNENQYGKIIFGVIEVINNDFVKTIRAWQINNNDKSIEQLDPSSVDFTDSYFTDTD